MTKLKVQQEWETKDVEDMFSDFCNLTDENSARENAHAYYFRCRNAGDRMFEAELKAEGYEQALLDILKNK